MKRERFFPAPFSEDNHIKRQNSGSSGGRANDQDSSAVAGLDRLQNATLNRPSTQLGFARNSFTNSLTSSSAVRIIRPGTTEPRESGGRGPVRVMTENVQVVAPTPKKYHHQLSFALRDGPKIGAVARDASKDFSDNITEPEKAADTFKIPFQSASFLQRNKRRMREFDEIEDSGFVEARDVKRFKSLDNEQDVKTSLDGSRSPRLESPSSTRSSAMSPYDHPHILVPEVAAARIEQQPHSDLSRTILANKNSARLPGRRLSEPMGLDKLLGPGSNELIENSADKYEALLKKWSECSVEEWKAGGEEISSRFTVIFNFAKDYLDKKLETYNGLSAILDSHTEILRERGKTMEHARQNAVRESGNIFG